MTWMQTATGRKVDFLKPDPASIAIEDIVHALSRICRFTGHTREFYSVAQHSLWVERRVRLLGGSHAEQRAALLHDATEAYVNDLSAPLKALLPSYREVEQRIWQAICERFDLPPRLPAVVKRADLEALMLERRDLLGEPLESWGPELEGIPLAGLGSVRAQQHADWVREDFRTAAYRLGLS